VPGVERGGPLVEVRHPGGASTNRRSIRVVEASPCLVLRQAVVLGFNYQGAPRDRGFDQKGLVLEARLQELREALGKARDGSGPVVHVHCRRLLLPGEPADRPQQDRVVAAKEAWSEHSRDWNAAFQRFLGDGIELSRDLHPGSYPAAGGGGRAFVGWVTQLLERDAMSKMFERGCDDSDADVIRVAQKVDTKLDVLTDKAKYASHNRLEFGRRLLRSHHLNTFRDAHVTSPMTDGGKMMFWDEINEMYIHLHKASIDAAMPAGRVLDTLTLVSLNIDLFRDIGDTINALLGFRLDRPAVNANSGVGTTMRGDVAMVQELYVRARADDISLSGVGMQDIDTFRVAATSVPVPLDRSACLLLDDPLVSRVSGVIGPYTNTSFGDRFQSEQDARGSQTQVACARVHIEGDRESQLCFPPPAPGWWYQRGLVFGGGMGPDPKLEWFKKRSDMNQFEVPSRNKDGWNSIAGWADLKHLHGFVVYDGGNEQDCLNGSVVTSSRVRGSKAATMPNEGTCTELRQPRTIWRELEENLGVAAADPVKWCVVTVTANSGGRGGELVSLRQALSKFHG